MNPLMPIRDFDAELSAYFEAELDRHKHTLSFIPDENNTSVLTSAMMGSVTFNNFSNVLSRTDGLDTIAARRFCKLFHAEHCNLRAITIEAASRVVFKSLTQRGDVVMSLDLRKKEHCNSEEFAFRFVNFGVDPQTQQLNYDAIENTARECRPQLIIVSPINYPLTIDYSRFSSIARDVGALLWCDISQTSGLVAGRALSSPFPYADVVTFTTHGALQGPQSAVILSSGELANDIDRFVVNSGHFGLHTAKLAALCARLGELEDQTYGAYVNDVVNNARALAEGLRQGGMKLVCGGTETHMVMVCTKNCAISARGAQELLAMCGIGVRICNMLTQDPTVHYEAIRFSTMPVTTRGVTPAQLRELGQSIGQFLQRPDEAETARLKEHVSKLATALPELNTRYVPAVVLKNLRDCHFID